MGFFFFYVNDWPCKRIAVILRCRSLRPYCATEAYRAASINTAGFQSRFTWGCTAFAVRCLLKALNQEHFYFLKGKRSAQPSCG